VTWIVIHRIYERDIGPRRPVVEHRFFGDTRAQAMGVFKAHMTTDSFLRGCQLKQKFGNIDCWAEWEVHQV